MMDYYYIVENKTYLAQLHLLNFKSNVWKYRICWVRRRCWGGDDVYYLTSSAFRTLPASGFLSFFVDSVSSLSMDLSRPLINTFIRMVCPKTCNCWWKWWNANLIFFFFKCMQLHRSRFPGGHHNWQLRSDSADGKRAQFRCSFSLQHGIIVCQDNFTVSKRRCFSQHPFTHHQYFAWCLLLFMSWSLIYTVFVLFTNPQAQ